MLHLYCGEPVMKSGGDQELQAWADNAGWNINPKLQRESGLSEEIAFFHLHDPLPPLGGIDPPQEVQSEQMKRKCKSSSCVVLKLMFNPQDYTSVVCFNSSKAVFSKGSFLTFLCILSFLALILIYDVVYCLSPSVRGNLDCENRWIHKV